MKLIFREPLPQDIEKINKFFIFLKNDFVPPFSDKERKKELDKICSGKAKAIIALTENEYLVGYLLWEQYSKNKKYGYILDVGVHTKYRRRGIYSTKLMEIVSNQMKKAGFKGIYYTTWHKNTAMIKASKKIGMKIVKIYLDEKFRGPGGKTILFKKDF